MTDTRDWADDAATEIIERNDPTKYTQLMADIAQALRAARRVQEGYVREGDVDWRVRYRVAFKTDPSMVLSVEPAEAAEAVTRAGEGNDGRQ